MILTMSSDLNIVNVREQFPALRDGYVFADSAGGSQVNPRAFLSSVEQAQQHTDPRKCNRSDRGLPQEYKRAAGCALFSVRSSISVSNCFP